MVSISSLPRKATEEPDGRSCGGCSRMQANQINPAYTLGATASIFGQPFPIWQEIHAKPRTLTPKARTMPPTPADMGAGTRSIPHGLGTLGDAGDFTFPPVGFGWPRGIQDPLFFVFNSHDAVGI